MSQAVEGGLERLTSLTSIKPLELLIRDLPRDASDSTAEFNLRVIHDLGQPENISRLLHQVLDDSALLERVAARSYHHTNHFDKIVLIDCGVRESYRLTLHFWSPPYADMEAEDEQIHDHRFSFWSHVLAGTLVSQNFVRDVTGIAYSEYQYIPEKLGVATVGNFYIPVGEAPLLETARSRAVAGESYSLGYYRIHRVVLPRERMTCTLVLRGPRQKNYASVFSNSQKYDPSRNEMFSPEHVAGRLSAIIAAIGGSERRSE